MTEKHSLLHDVKMSRCETPWEKLRVNEDGTRVCENCDSVVLQVSGLEEHEVEARAASLACIGAGQLPVNRRRDGTLIVEKNPCREEHLRSVVWWTVSFLVLGYFVIHLSYGGFFISLGLAATLGMITTLAGALMKSREAFRIGFSCLFLPATLAFGVYWLLMWILL